MNSIGKKQFLIIYFLITALDLCGVEAHSFYLNLVFKPMIVASLLIYLFSNGAHKIPGAVFAMLGLFLSWIGDWLLIFQEHRPLFFIGGLVSFLIAHIFFIIYYIQTSKGKRLRKFGAGYLFIMLIVAYGIGLCWLLKDHLGDLKIPVFAYATVLTLMNIFALLRYGKVNPVSFRLVMGGALLFACSDGLLALNLFLTPIPFGGILIMATYAAAQYLIAQSILTNPANGIDNPAV